MASLADVCSLVIPSLSLKDAGALASSLPAISRLHRGHSAGLLAASAASLSSGVWHAGVESVLGVEEYAAISKACKGVQVEPFDLAASSPERTEAALAAILAR